MQNLLQGTTGAPGQQPTAPAAPARRLKSHKGVSKASGASGNTTALLYLKKKFVVSSDKILIRIFSV